MPIRKKFTIEQAEKRQPDMIKGQIWLGSDFKYKYLCKKHGVYTQRYSAHHMGRRCSACSYYLAGRGLSHTPEYGTVRGHHTWIFKRDLPGYKGMPFYDGWNPNKNGSILAGMDWIIENLGKKPKGCSLHIVNHEKGFVPGNLEWTSPQKQSAHRMFQIIAKLKHHIKELEGRLESLGEKA